VQLIITKQTLIQQANNKIKILVLALLLSLLFVYLLVLPEQPLQTVYVLVSAHTHQLFKMELSLVFVMLNKDLLNNLLVTVCTLVVLLILLEINMEFVFAIQDTSQLEMSTQELH